MPSFGWKAPLPFKLGGGGDALVDSFYRAMRNARPEALRSSDPTSEVDIENQVAARMLALGWRETQRRVLQRDPRKLGIGTRPVNLADGTRSTTSRLERMEAILGLHVSDSSTLRERRANVYAKVVAIVSTTRSNVASTASAIFGSWLQTITENRVTDVDYAGKVPAGTVHANYGTNATVFSANYPGEFNATYPWRSGLAVVDVHILPPASVPQDVVTATTEKFLTALDDILPAWMAGVVSQWGPGQTLAGFYADISLVGLTAI